MKVYLEGRKEKKKKKARPSCRPELTGSSGGKVGGEKKRFYPVDLHLKENDFLR